MRKDLAAIASVLVGFAAIGFIGRYLVIPYLVTSNGTVTVAELEATALALPIIGLIFENLFIAGFMVVGWLLLVIALILKSEKEKAGMKGATIYNVK
jgi:hypothetical protein